MPALNFTVFIDKILSGEKTCTVRAKRKRPIKKGDKLYLYTGMRHKNCQKLGEAVCLGVISIDFRTTDIFFDGTEICFSTFHRGSKNPWPLEWQNKLALDDGFKNWEELSAYFIKSHKMKPDDIKLFDIIQWRDFQGEKDAN